MGCAPGGHPSLAEELMYGNNYNSEGKYRIPGAHYSLGEELFQTGTPGTSFEIDAIGIGLRE